MSSISGCSTHTRKKAAFRHHGNHESSVVHCGGGGNRDSGIPTPGFFVCCGRISCTGTFSLPVSTKEPAKRLFERRRCDQHFSTCR